ncbi:MAG: hypothetical protein M4D80_07095 [Myxococcota bacterium]|nr:hypothetical protein [Deltaproteobacteria bacterium]MDQ3334908.1 hypothetical protein [Myxococcota bacterium]
MSTRFLTSALVLSLGACGGGSDTDPGSGSDTGEGTNTLFVSGNVEASPALTNARSSAEFTTDFEVQIKLNDVGVTAGTVTITSSTGKFPLTYVGDNGRWEGRANGYDEVYILDIVSGTNEVTGVRVDGPDFHTFIKPTAGTTVDSTLPLEVTWDSDQDAETSAIRADNIDWVSIPDSGKFMLGVGALDADADQAKQNELRLMRLNRVVPAGAVAGSEFSVRVENRIDVIAAPNPAL